MNRFVWGQEKLKEILNFNEKFVAGSGLGAAIPKWFSVYCRVEWKANMDVIKNQGSLYGKGDAKMQWGGLEEAQDVGMKLEQSIGTNF